MQAEKGQAAIYCRVASKDDWAIERQLETMRNFAADKGYTDCAEYSDNGESGHTLNRPALSRLNADMSAGKIQTVLVMDTSRIGRGIALIVTWLEMAKALGVEVTSLNGDINGSETLYTILKEISKQSKAN